VSFSVIRASAYLTFESKSKLKSNNFHVENHRQVNFSQFEFSSVLDFKTTETQIKPDPVDLFKKCSQQWRQKFQLGGSSPFLSLPFPLLNEWMNEYLLVLQPAKAGLRTIQYKCHIKCHKMLDKIQFTIAIKRWIKCYSAYW